MIKQVSFCLEISAKAQDAHNSLMLEILVRACTRRQQGRQQEHAQEDNKEFIAKEWQ